MSDNRENFRRGLIDGLSVAVGYFAVSFTLGINASNVGIKWYQSALMSALNYTSAGQAAAIDIMTEGARYGSSLSRQSSSTSATFS